MNDSMKTQELIFEFQTMFQKKIDNVEQLPFEDVEGITGKASMRSPAIRKFSIRFYDGERLDVIGKFKSARIIRNGIRLLNYDRDLRFYYLLLRYHGILGFDKSHIREIDFYKEVDADLRRHLIPTFGFYRSDRKDRYMILMQEVASSKKEGGSRIREVLDTILHFHRAHYNRKASVSTCRLNFPTSRDYKRSRPLLKYMFDKLEKSNREFFDPEQLKGIRAFIEDIHLRNARLREHRTLTHNDFNLRNIFFAEEGVLIYDWELASFQNPEHDVIEFLIFVLHEMEDEEVFETIDYYKRGLLTSLDLEIDEEDYRQILEFNILEYIVNKLSVYRIVDVTLELGFVKQMCINANRLLCLLTGGKEGRK